MSKSKLQSAINSANSRYEKGLNDDDQVARMVAIDNQTKGYSFIVDGNSYKLVTDLEKLTAYADKFGYWSEEVKRFNNTLMNKGSILYCNSINEQYLEIAKQGTRTRK